MDWRQGPSLYKRVPSTCIRVYRPRCHHLTAGTPYIKDGLPREHGVFDPLIPVVFFHLQGTGNSSVAFPSQSELAWFLVTKARCFRSLP